MLFGLCTLSKELYHTLRQMRSQLDRTKKTAKGTPEFDKLTHELVLPTDFAWMRDFFRKNAGTLSAEMHSEFEKVIEADTYHASLEKEEVDLYSTGDNIRGSIKKESQITLDLSKMEKMANDELLRQKKILKHMKQQFYRRWVKRDK